MYVEDLKGYDNWKLSDGIRKEKLPICDTCGEEIQGKVFRVRGDYYCEDCFISEFEVREVWE